MSRTYSPSVGHTVVPVTRNAESRPSSNPTPPAICIIVEAREVYGSWIYRPVNDAAIMLAKIAKTKTLTAETMLTAQRMGMRVQTIDGRELVQQ